MIVAHEAFLDAWDNGRGTVPSCVESDAGIASWIAERIEDAPEARPASDFVPEYGDAVAADPGPTASHP